MAIQNYVHPQLTIAQVLARTAAASVSRINPIVVGPQYFLNRYGIELVPGVAFSSTAQLLPYTSFVGETVTPLNSDYEVDAASVSVFAKDTEAVLAAIAADTDGTNDINIKSATEPHILKISSGSATAFAGTSRNSVFNGRDVQVGDLVYVTSTNGGTTKRTVVGLEGAAGTSSYGSNSSATLGFIGNSEYNPQTSAVAAAFTAVSAPVGYSIAGTASSWKGLLEGSKLGTAYGEEFTLVCSTAGAPGTAKFDVSSRSGGFAFSGLQAASTTVTGGTTCAVDTAKLGGATLTITHASGVVIPLGATFKFQVTAPYDRLTTAQVKIESGNVYTGPADTTYLIEVIVGDADTTWSSAQVRITDTAGIDTPVTRTVTENGALALGGGGFGLSVVFDSVTTGPAQVGLRKGDIYFVHAKAAVPSTASFDKIVLDGPAVNTALLTSVNEDLAIEFRLPYTGEIASTAAADASQWTLEAGGVLFQASAQVFVAGRSTGQEWCTLKDAIGTLYVSYKALVPPAANETWITVDSVSELTTKLGVLDMANELAYGVSWAVSGAQGRRVYALRTAGTSAEDFAAALKKIESTDMVYALAIVSDDVEVKQVAAQHALAMSARTVKNFRRVYVGTDSPGEYTVLAKKANATNFTATVTSGGLGNTLVTFPDASALLTSRNIVAGDKVTFPVLDETFIIKRVITDTELELESGPVSPISPAAVVEVWKTNTPESQAAYVRNTSKALGTRRAVNVWTENGTTFTTDGMVVIPNKFVACEIAGLRCAVQPQQGLTHTEIKSVQAAPAMYSRYSRDLLNSIAADGVFIITQDAESGAVYIRHQLTTDPNNGSLYYEDSVGVNLDNISFRVKDLLTEYIGRKNATSRTVEEITNKVKNLLNEYTQTTLADIDIGPALIRWENLVVAIDPVLKDRINVSATLIMPLPLNYIDVVLLANVDV